MGEPRYTRIILSGLPGAGKGELAKRLSAHYGWKVFSIGNEWRRRHQESAPEVPFDRWWRKRTEEENKAMDAWGRATMLDGNVITEARYTLNYKGIDALCVYLHASIDVRTKRALSDPRYAGKQDHDIKATFRRREEDEVVTGKRLFGLEYDFREPDWYHLSINTGLHTIDQEVAIIRGALEGSPDNP